MAINSKLKNNLHISFVVVGVAVVFDGLLSSSFGALAIINEMCLKCDGFSLHAGERERDIFFVLTLLGLIAKCITVLLAN